ncbi:MAG: prolipoprotein diacylglyceryl transferase [Treponema sp.]|nr:prolipoprotein diacylglyceryl transferase [Treponema sp.]
MILSIPFPSWLHPEIIQGFPIPVRWYGLMYIAAFATAFFLYRKQIKERNFPMGDDELYDLFFKCIIALLIGARIVATLVYETSDTYRREPWLIFWPFRDGRFTGLQGMSYHGGVIGGALGIVIYSAVKKYDFREIGDMFAASIPLGYTFGRIGNFTNGELWGRMTASPLGMIFPDATTYPASLDWVREAAEKTGVPIPAPDALMNLPRHPSQLYEAFFEGVVLWVIIWLLRNKKPFKGFLIGLYLFGYGVIRFILEYFREPDVDLGYRFEIVKTSLPQALYHPALSFSTGQMFCVAMVAAGVVWWIVAARLPDNKAIRVYSNQLADQPPAGDRKKRRKLRKKAKRK